MTTYTAITNAEIDQDSPLTETLATKWRDNPLAMFEGSTGAPNLSYAALGTLAAGSDIKIQVTSNSATFLIVQPGVVRVNVTGLGGGNYTFSANGSIFASGVATDINVDYTLPNGPVAILISTTPGGGTPILTLRTNGPAIWPVSVTNLSAVRYNGAT